MVLQVGSDPGAVHQDVDTELDEMFGRTDTGEHQQLRTVDGPGRHDDLPVGVEGLESTEGVVQVLDAGCRTVRDQHTRDLAVGEDIQIIPVQDRVQVGHRG